MKLKTLLILTLLLCILLPVVSNADQFDDAMTAIKNEDFEKAQELLQPLVDENNAAAQTIMGTLYVKGQGVEKDATKGMSLIMKAASQGYEQARGIAAVFCRELADLGDEKAMYNMGYMCFHGWGGEQDSNSCIKWLEKAAENGHLRSAKMLYKIYSKGMFGITPDEEKASYWSNFAQN